MKNELLSEEKYQRTNRKLMVVAILILIVGLLLGGTIIFKGIPTSKNNQKLQDETKKLEKVREELEAKGVTISYNYREEDGYKLHLIDSVLDPSFNHCHFD